MNDKEMLEIINVVIEMNNALDGCITDRTQPREESVRLRRGQQKVPNMKYKEEKKMKKTEETLWDHYESIIDTYQEYQKEKKGQRTQAI